MGLKVGDKVVMAEAGMAFTGPRTGLIEKTFEQWPHLIRVLRPGRHEPHRLWHTNFWRLESDEILARGNYAD